MKAPNSNSPLVFMACDPKAPQEPAKEEAPLSEQLAEIAASCTIRKVGSEWNLFVSDTSVYKSDNLSYVEQFAIAHYMVQPEIVIETLPSTLDADRDSYYGTFGTYSNLEDLV